MKVHSDKCRVKRALNPQLDFHLSEQPGSEYAHPARTEKDEAKLFDR
jgi:hypothetical protein